MDPTTIPGTIDSVLVVLSSHLHEPTAEVFGMLVKKTVVVGICECLGSLMALFVGSWFARRSVSILEADYMSDEGFWYTLAGVVVFVIGAVSLFATECIPKIVSPEAFALSDMMKLLGVGN